MIFFRYKILITAIALCLSYACQSEDEVIANVLPKETIVTIIVDMELTQAAYKIKSPKAKFDIEKLYTSIYIENNTTKHDFEESLNYLSTKPQEMEEIYNSVITELSRKQAELSTN